MMSIFKSVTSLKVISCTLEVGRIESDEDEPEDELHVLASEIVQTPTLPS